MRHTICLVGIALLGLLVPTPAWAAEDDLPNIVLLMGDDHGWEETGYNGHPHLQTPVLDEMASQGLRLDHFYAAHPTCSPTRGSVLTGRHPNRYGTFTPNHSIRPEEITIAHILSGAGYLCGHFGKWHVGPVKAESPTNPSAMGFDEWLSHDNFFEMNPKLSRNGGPPQEIPGESSEILVDEAIRFIRKAQDKEKPFLTVVWFGSPHQPYSGLQKDLERYDDVVEKYQGRTVRVTSHRTGRATERPLGLVLRERFAEITAMDRAIGTLRDYLEQEGLRENTLLWYCGDNGTPGSGLIASPFRGSKGQIYEGGVRVPGIIEWPARIHEPHVSNVSAVTSDILPTICAVTDQPLPDRPLDGISLKPLIEGEMTQRPSPIFFWEFDARGGLEPYIDPELQKGTTPLVKLMGGTPTRNFRNFRYPKIVPEDFSGARAILHKGLKLHVRDGEKELFNLRNDPAEEKNLLERRPEDAQRMTQKLRKWQESVLRSLTGADYQ